jgi:hypothetical protein
LSLTLSSGFAALVTARIVPVVLLTAFVAHARSGGIAARGCQGCHGGNTHTSTIEFSPPTFMPGDTVTVTVTARGPGANAGLYVTATRGSFDVVSGQNTRLLNGDVVQSSPKATSGGQATFQLRWVAPRVAGGAELSAFTVLGNGDGRSAGDTNSETSQSVVFGCAGTTFFRDFDSDGVGSRANGTTLDCSTPPGFSTTETDCDDFDAAVRPGAVERCNARDDDCDGMIDEGLSSAATWPDLDGDGYGDRRGSMTTGCSASGRSPNDLDCDDRDPKVRPGATEVCNLRDDDCNGRIDENVRVRCGTGWCEALGITCDPMSCQPGRPLVERCNLLDDDCDGLMDEGSLCAVGQACVRGTCVVTDVEGPEPDAGPMSDAGPMTDAGSVSQSPPQPRCATMPGSFVLASLVVLRLKRRLRT